MSLRRHIAATLAAFLSVQMISGGALASGAKVPISNQILTATTSTHKVVALTFDDGPSAYTPQVLTLLERYHAHATFFVIGLQAALDPAELRREVRDGDIVGDHTFTHANLQALSDSQVAWQLQTTQDAIHQDIGAPTHWFRPPYGAIDLRISSIAASLGMQTVTWSVDPRDWSLPGTDAIVARVLSAVQPGSVVLMHDGGGYRGESVAALSVILPALQARGYRMVTLDELFFPWLATQVAQRCPSGACQAAKTSGSRHGTPTLVVATPTPTPTPADPISCKVLQHMPWVPPALLQTCR